MTRRSPVTHREFQDALAAHKAAKTKTRKYTTCITPPEPLHGIHVSVDVRLTTADLAKLDAEQVRAVYEGADRLAAMGAR